MQQSTATKFHSTYFGTILSVLIENDCTICLIQPLAMLWKVFDAITCTSELQRPPDATKTNYFGGQVIGVGLKIPFYVIRAQVKAIKNQNTATSFLTSRLLRLYNYKKIGFLYKGCCRSRNFVTGICYLIFCINFCLIFEETCFLTKQDFIPSEQILVSN